MINVYEKLYELDEELANPQLYVGACGNVALSLATATFKVEYSDGRAKVSLNRYMTRDQARALGEALIRFADEETNTSVMTVTGGDQQGLRVDVSGRNVVIQ